MLLKVNLANILTVGLIGAIWYALFRVGEKYFFGAASPPAAGG